ncbi:MAG: alkaline phosphatase family protein [Acetobacteraceae bacterium]
MLTALAHIVVLMLENQSFDRLLGGLAGSIPGLDGVRPEAPFSNHDWPSGALVAQSPTTARSIARDPGHELDEVLRQIDAGAMSGFVREFAQLYPKSSTAERAEVMGWYPAGFLPALHALASAFVVADHWHASVPGPTWPNRLFAHSGTSLGHTDMPEGIFHPGLHLYDQRTLYDELADAGVGFRIYYGDFPQSLVLTHQLEPDRLRCYRPFRHFDHDVAAHDFPPFVFIEPAYFEPEENDQHPPQDVLRGDRLIGGVYHALLRAPQLFARTLLIVLHDEHGGFFDHVTPPATVAPDHHTEGFNFTELGVRVPAVFVSPLLDPGVVHAVFDHTSLLRAASELWGVAPLGRRAAEANSPLAALALRDRPRSDLAPVPIADMTLPGARPSLNRQTQALFAFSQYLESQIRDSGTREKLMLHAHTAMAGAAPAGRLAVARLEAFLAERGAG